MSQNYTADAYAGGHVAATDLQNMENNFDALKTNFSGASAPSSPSALQWWMDTSNNILKLRNEANTAWLEIYDFDSQAFKAGVASGTITAAMISDAARKPSLVTSQAITPASVAATGAISGASVTSPIGTFTSLVGAYSMIMTKLVGEDEYTAPDTSPLTVATCRIYIPTGAVYVVLSARLKSQAADRIAYGTFTINSNTSTACSVYGNTYAWSDGGYLNVSALNGYYTVTVNLYGNYTYTSYMDGFSLYLW